MALRDCDACGKRYEAKRLNSRFCGGTCRKRNARTTVPSGPDLTGPRVMSLTGDGTVLAMTRTELEAGGRLGTSLGQVALLLASRLDAQVRESGMGVAAIVREHRTALAEALKGAAVAADPVDELRARRDRKRHAG